MGASRNPQELHAASGSGECAPELRVGSVSRALLAHGLLALTLLGGCATRAWVLTQSHNTLFAYEAFLKKHPGSKYAVDAWARLDSILLAEAVDAGDFDVYERFFVRYPVGQFAARDRMERVYSERARAIGCPFAHKAFLREFPEGELAEAVRRDTAAIHQQLRALAEAAREGLPRSTEFAVTRELGGPGVPEYVVTAALIPGRALDDGDPGHYFSTVAALANAVHRRCLDVVRAVSRLRASPPDSALVVRIRQGVGLESRGFTSSFGRPMTIFEVAVRAPVLEGDAALAMPDEEVEQRWEVRHNLVPELMSR